MEEQRIIFETARLAKEKGFNLRCEYFYNAGSGWKLQSDSILRTGHDEFVEAPTQAQLQKWLREKGFFVSVEADTYNEIVKYNANILNLKTLLHPLDGFTIFPSYENAMEEGLQEGLKLLNDKD